MGRETDFYRVVAALQRPPGRIAVQSPEQESGILLCLLRCQIVTGEAVMLVPEPENEHDQHAIAIKLLDGTSLGYVPRDVNQSPLFPGQGQVTFGHVRSVGNPQSSPELHGAIVSPRRLKWLPL